MACQKYFIEQQLYAGVRALDLRTRWHGDDMVMVHGDFICHTPDHKNRSKNKTFRSVLDTVIAYLDKHPSGSRDRDAEDRQRQSGYGQTGADKYPQSVYHQASRPLLLLDG